MSDSWLRTHFHEFVYPAFMAAEKKSTEIEEPFHVQVAQSAPEELPTELRKLWTLCKEMNVPWVYDVRERNVHNGTSKHRESARLHHGVINDTLDSSLAALRDEGCSRLFLGGRDVWTFAVMAERRRIPNLYVPELSRNVSSNPATKPFLEAVGFTGDELFLDTGYVGSIPRNLQKFWDRPFKFRLVSQTDIAIHETGGILVDVDPDAKSEDCGCQDSDEHAKNCVPRIRKISKRHYKSLARPNQLHPNRDARRSEALETEYLSKYWKSGTTESVLERKTWAPQDAFKTLFGKQLLRIRAPKVTHDEAGINYDPPTKLAHEMTFADHTIKTSMAIYHDDKVALVNIADAKRLVPGLYEWYLTLPEIDPPPAASQERIIQYFADRQSIQRTALLTSMLWRGIPFWKAAMKPVKKPDLKKFSGGNAIWGGNNINVVTGGTGGTNAITTFPMTNTITYNMMVDTATTTMTQTGFANQLINAQATMQQLAAMQQTNAALNAAVGGAGMPITKDMALQAHAAAQKALPQKLAPCKPEPGPIKPMPCIILGPAKKDAPSSN
jgi:hypothetical protein